MDDDNVVRFGSVQGGREEAKENTLPVNDYVIFDIDGEEWFGSGFLVFTPQHIAIMRDFNNGLGPVPIVVVPLVRIRGAELIEAETEQDDTAELPF